ncbi:uncharacterized protein K489DRAFT_115886 [Dissoconium aciculare CBS 342.82]|uniref:Uncharacterized protein n=1 Tax=Dissoconium aciculare CBS 342.82 TaxID=1314786 RepID=A0A6J3MHR2_9PEZI|nr:uncharacterized protein K489DRAFT_115886 [Dissoconium aciculare CBS 342.82]KAF1826432.1 hypothetical protein K489DRAFT_115886 [Dissoconium aciculare CBS 342.82]
MHHQWKFSDSSAALRPGNVVSTLNGPVLLTVVFLLEALGVVFPGLIRPLRRNPNGGSAHVLRGRAQAIFSSGLRPNHLSRGD